MRKAIAILLLCAFPGFCSLPGGLQIDVRTTGSNNNSGGFNPTGTSCGTDYSQQASPQIAYTDLVISVTTTNYTSVLNAVTSAVVCNTIQIISGTNCTPGFYYIASETASSPNFATVDRSMGTAAAVCTANLGGSLLTNAAAFAIAVSSNTVHTKTGTYTLTGTTNTPNVPTFSWVGYGTTHFDGGTCPTITTATNSTDLIDDRTTQVGVFDNLCLSNTASTRAIGFVKISSNATGVFRNCVFTGFSNGINGDNQGSHDIYTLYLQNTKILNGTSDGTVTEGGVNILAGSQITGNGAHGVFAKNSGGACNDSTISFNSTGGVSSDGDFQAVNCAFVGNTGAGVLLTQSGGSISTVNSVYYANTTYGFTNSNSGTQNVEVYANNAYGSNGTAPFLNYAISASATANDVPLGACNPFVSASTGNYTLSTCGGTALKAKGYPGISQNGTGYLDIGPLQSQGSSGGGSAPHAYSQ